MNINKVWAVFFSPTGTTKKVVIKIADTIAERLHLQSGRFDFTLPAARNNALSFTANDIVVFGTPVYAGRMPNVLLKYLDLVKGNDTISVPVVVYGNRCYDDALIELRDILEKNKFRTLAASAFIGEHSFSNILAAGRPDVADINIAGNFALRVVEKLETVSSVSDLEPIYVKGNPFPYGGYYQPHDRNGNPINFRNAKPSTNADCIDCKICASVCPMGSISYENTKEIVGICIKCGACIKSCPAQAKYYEDAGYLQHKHDLEESLKRRAEPELFI
jgi:ferredoxin/flavodoxin